MPTETTPGTEPTEATTTEPGQEAPAATADDEPLGEAGKRALTAEREARKAAEKRLAEYEAAEKARRESEMTELEKAQNRVAELEKAGAEAAAKALRAEVAADTGVPAGLLTGDTEDALRASAAAILEFRGTAPKAPTPDGQGRTGTTVSSGIAQLTLSDIKGWAPEWIVEAQARGQLNNVLGIK